jgi:hypothetical protein
MPEAATARSDGARRLAEARREREAEERRKREKASREAIQQIQETRQEIEALASRLQEQADAMRKQSRRTLDEDSNARIVFANAHIRFAGAMLQGLRRTASVDRTLVTRQADNREDRRRREWEEQQRQVRDHGRLVDRLQLPTNDPMAELYGEILEGDMTHA